jgi:hypothetical protein
MTGFTKTPYLLSAFLHQVTLCTCPKTNLAVWQWVRARFPCQSAGLFTDKCYVKRPWPVSGRKTQPYQPGPESGHQDSAAIYRLQTKVNLCAKP